MPQPRTILIGLGAAWELAAILTRRVPTISQVWYENRHTHGRHLLYWVTGWVIWHLWGEEPHGVPAVRGAR